MSRQTCKARGKFRRILSVLGPGLITGAADDDPSGIATYSVAGAKLGTGLLWTGVFTWPLMAAVQMMCARVGMVTGMGLIRALRRKLPKPVVFVISLALFAANTFNVGADLLGMADAAQMWVPIGLGWFVLLFGALITVASVKCSYEQFARILRWLCLALFAYVVTGFIIRPDWLAVVKATFKPSLALDRSSMQMLVAILGTTISPYLFVWQASQEVEEAKAQGQTRVSLRRGATRGELDGRKWDVGIGTFFSNLVMFFIILTTGFTLHAHGKTDIETSRQAAEALRPLAGKFAETLYSLGLIGVGLLSIPTLAGSAAYAFAETFAWRQGLNEKPKSAWRFYSVFALSMVAGMAMDLFHLKPVKALYWTAVINGVLSPFMLLGVLLVASDRRLMQNQPSPKVALGLVGFTVVLMLSAAAGMFLL